jgi:diguanylate cyclase (GGDEF)-like protein
VSFRNRLGLFFVLIVIVPMVAVAVLLFGLLGKSERSMGDADVGARQETSRNIFNEQQLKADRLLKVVGNDRVFGAALQAGDLARADKRAKQLLASRGIERIVFVKGSVVLLKVGDRTAIAPAVRPLKTEQRNLGVLGVSVIDAKTYARQVSSFTGLEVVVRNGGRLLATTFPNGEAPKAERGQRRADVGGDSYHVNEFGAGFAGQDISITTFGSPTISSSAGESRLVIGAILAGFLLLALACAVLVSRSLQQQLASFLDAARKLAGGDFKAKVTTVGKDEFAGLGQEFNKMSSELEQRLDELRKERERVQQSVRQLGAALGAKLDRDEMLKLVVDTAVDAVAADASRAHVPGSATLQQNPSHGNMNGLEAAVRSVEDDAVRSGRLAEVSGEHANAMAHPLTGTNGTNGGSSAVGVLSVGRVGRAFTQSERELFRYLAEQAQRSMESVDSYESASRAALIDYGTDLLNKRSFDHELRNEVARAARYGKPLALVIMDLDDFKAINTNYLWHNGDEVLRAVATILRANSRDKMDHPARYGGEELALILPETTLEGAFNAAERVREQIAALRIPLVSGSGVMQITVSCGVAALPNTPASESALVEAAARALAEAKTTGKNKTVRAR